MRGLEAISGVSNAYISQVESGRILAVSIEIIQKLAIAMKIDACWLAFGKKTKKVTI